MNDQNTPERELVIDSSIDQILENSAVSVDGPEY